CQCRGVSGILRLPMPSCWPLSGARSRRLLIALAALMVGLGNPRSEGDDSPAGKDGARVEINGSSHAQARKRNREVQIDLGDSKGARVMAQRTRKRNVVEIGLGDSKDATVELVRERGDANVEINGYQMQSRMNP